MRLRLLQATAAAALLVGTSFAAAQGTQPRQPQAGGGAERGAQEQDQGGRQQGRQPGQRGQAKSKQDQGKGQTTGQGSRDRDEPRQGQQREQGRTSGQGQRDQDRDPDRTRGQGQRDRDRDQDRTQGQGQRDRDRDQDRTRGQGQQEQRQGEQRDRGQTTGQGARGGATVTLTTEQRTHIRETVLRGSNVPRARNVNFSIRVGTVVPRTIKVEKVPDVIVEVRPEWDGFLYFIVNDEIIIVDADNHKIVAVIDV